MSTPETPDRYTSLRSPFRQAKCTLRTSLSLEALSNYERYTRTRDINRDLFRSHHKSISRAKSQVTRSGNGVLTPHHTPSFVHSDVNYAPTNRHQTRPRFVSLGGIWSVGGRIAAVPTQLHGVDLGSGELLASGTTAPFITAAFADNTVENDRGKEHEARLAFALNIDRARRVLPVSPPSSPQSQSP